MAFAAAAAAGARNARIRVGGSSGTSVSSHNTAACVAAVTSAILFGVGLTYLVESADDTRERSVANYDAQVQRWVENGRAVFGSANLSATARWASAAGGSLEQRMNASEAQESTFHDSENSEGLMGYVPLKFEASFDLGTYYPVDPNSEAANDRDSWSVLPSFDDAETISFDLQARNRDGSVSVLSTVRFPMVYAEAVPSRTPAPEMKCRREQGGMYNVEDRKCWVAQRLSEVCLQVRQGPDGDWAFTRKELPSNYNNSQQLETYGCHSYYSYNPALYTRDRCYGPLPFGCKSVADAVPHAIQVTVRSAGDPFIRAEELTKNSFDFGLSSWSRMTTGTVLLVMAAILALVPLCRARELLSKGKKRDVARSSLKWNRELDDFAPAAEGAGVYGNRMI